MQTATPTRWVLPAIISIVGLTDGILHLLLDIVLFRGRFWGRPSFGPPPGAGNGAPPTPPPAPPPSNPILHNLNIANLTGLPLNELFLLNAIGYAVLVVVLLVAVKIQWKWTWLIDVVLILYAAASIIAWFDIGQPNPRGLGVPSKALEVALIFAAIVHLTTLLSQRTTDAQPMEATR